MTNIVIIVIFICSKCKYIKITKTQFARHTQLKKTFYSCFI